MRDDRGRMDSALATAMAKEPHHRFPTCRHFANALAGRGDRVPVAVVGPSAITQLAPVPAPAIPPPPKLDAAGHMAPTGPIPDARRTALIVGVVAALLAVGLVAFLGARLGQSPDSPTAQTPSLTRPAWPERWPHPGP